MYLFRQAVKGPLLYGHFATAWEGVHHWHKHEKSITVIIGKEPFALSELDHVMKRKVVRKITDRVLLMKKAHQRVAEKHSQPTVSSRHCEHCGMATVTGDLQKVHCDTCIADFNQSAHLMKSNEAVSRCISAAQSLPPVAWSEDVHWFSVKRDCPLLYEMLEGVVGGCPEFRRWAEAIVPYRTMILDELCVGSPNMDWQQLNGGQCPSDVDLASHRIVWPPNVGLGIATLRPRAHGAHHAHDAKKKHANDHFVLQRVHHDADDLKEMIDYESGYIIRGSQYVRRGGAASYYLPQHGPKPTGLTKITENKRRHNVQPHKQTPALPIFYVNKNGETKKHYAYSNMHGRLMKDAGFFSNTKNNNHHEMKTVPGARRVHLSNILSRMLYFGLLEKVGILDHKETTCLRKFCSDFKVVAEVETELMQLGVDSMWDRFALLYGCTLTRSINHQAVSAHIDNTIRETMSLFSRHLHHSPGVCQAPLGSNGHTALLNYGVGVGMIANSSVVHASFANVWHVADRTRSKTNVSQVGYSSQK